PLFFGSKKISPLPYWRASRRLNSIPTFYSSLPLSFRAADRHPFSFRFLRRHDTSRRNRPIFPHTIQWLGKQCLHGWRRRKLPRPKNPFHPVPSDKYPHFCQPPRLLLLAAERILPRKDPFPTFPRLRQFFYC